VVRAPEGETHFHGPVAAVIQGEHNNVTIVYQSGRRAVAPFLAPPAPAFPLVGRDKELAAVRQIVLGSVPGRRIAMTGLPGVGKTALALAAAYDPEVLAGLPDGVLWAGLGHDADPLRHLSAWAAALGIPPKELPQPADIESWAQLVHGAIGTRRMLLVIDDAWAPQTALALRLGGPGCATVLTTRIPSVALSFTFEVRQVSELSARDGFRLMNRLAPQVLRAEPAAALELVQLTGGLPLELMLLGRHLRLQTLLGRHTQLAATLSRLRIAGERLQLAEQQAPIDRHPSLPLAVPLSLRAIIGLSVEQLGTLGAEALVSLSAFKPKPNTFSGAAAVAISAASADAISALADAGLVEPVGTDRFAVHQAVHDFACAERIPGLEEDRMVDFFTATPGADGPEDEDLENILTALNMAHARGRTPQLLHGVHAAFPLLDRLGLYQVAEIQLRRALAAAESLADQAGQVRSQLRLGTILMQRGELQSAEGYLRAGVRGAHESGDSRDETDCLLRLGWLVGMQGDPETAERLFNQALELAHEEALRRQRSEALAGMCWLAGRRGNYRLAREHGDAGLAAARELGDDELIADVLQILGWAVAAEGDYELGAAYFQECLELARIARRHSRIVDALQGLGWIASMRGRFVEARPLLEEALSQAEKIGYHERVSLLLAAGWVLRELRQTGEARAVLLEGVSLARQGGRKEKLGWLLHDLALLEVETAEGENTEAYLHEALDIARQADVHDLTVSVLRTYGRLVMRQHQHERARAFLGEALDLERDEHNDAIRAILLHSLAEVELADGNAAAAADLFADSIELALPAGAAEVAALSKYGAAQAAAAVGELLTARQLGATSAAELAAIASPKESEVKAWLTKLPPALGE
jgi:tetratricopeptide (TPR) repeat protein